MSEDLIKIPVGGKIIVLKGSDWDSDIEIDEVTQIQYDNLFGEIVTVPPFITELVYLRQTWITSTRSTSWTARCLRAK